MESLTLYSFRRCPFAMRVRFALHEKRLPFSIVEEDLKNFSPALLSLHPEGKVPVLLHGNHVLYESAIILEYLEDQFPSVPLMPAEAGLKADVRLWGYWCNAIYKPALDRFKYGTSRFPEAECVDSAAKVQACFKKLNEALATSVWLVGGHFSLAEVLVFPFVRQFLRIEPQPKWAKGYSHLAKWAEALSQRPSFLKTLKA